MRGGGEKGRYNFHVWDMADLADRKGEGRQERGEEKKRKGKTKPWSRRDETGLPMT